MKIRFKKTAFVVLIIACNQVISFQKLQAQTATLRENIQQVLTEFYKATSDKNLQQEIAEVKAFYTSNAANDSVAAKLLHISKWLNQYNDEYYCAININFYDTAALLDYTKMVELYTTQLLPVKENLLYAAALQSLGAQYLILDKTLNTSRKYFEMAFAIRKKTLAENHPDYIESMLSLSNIDIFAGQYEKALKPIQRCIKITEENGMQSTRLYAEELESLSSIYLHLFDYRKANEILEKTIHAWDKTFNDDSIRFALRLCHIAFIYDELSGYKRALELFQLAKNTTQNSLEKNNRIHLLCLNGIGEMYYRMGLYKDALSVCKEVLALTKKWYGDTYPALPVYLSNTATNYIKLGEYSNALPLLQYAIKIDTTAHIANNSGIPYLFYHLSNVYISVGQYDEAFSTVTTGLESCKKYNLRERYLSRLMTNAAILYGQKNNYDSAIDYGRKAVEISKELMGDHHRDYLKAANNLASLYIIANKFSDAKSLLQEILTTSTNIYGNEHPEYAAALFNIGDLYSGSNNNDSARFYFQQALAIQQKTLGEQHPDYIKTLNRLGQVEFIAGNHQQAAQYFTKANCLAASFIKNNYSFLSEQEKLNLANDNAAQFSFLPSLIAMQQYSSPAILKQVYNNTLILKSMVLQDQQNIFSAIKNSSDSEANTLYELWRNNKSLLCVQLLKPVKDRVSYMDSLLLQVKEDERKLSAISAAFNAQQQMQQVTVDDIINHLGSHEASIEFIRYNPFNKSGIENFMYAALLLLPADSVPVFVPLCSEKRLHDLMANQNNTNSFVKLFYPGIANNSSLSDSLSNKLYSLVWKPLEKYLTGIHTIYYAPVGTFNRIAFNALRINTKSLLINKYNLVQFLSTRSVTLSQKGGKPAAIDMWGNINYDYQQNDIQNSITATNDVWAFEEAPGFNFYNQFSRGERGGKWRPLPGTKAEIDSISKICFAKGIKVSSISESYATEENFKVFHGKSPEVMHLATHGFFLAGKSSIHVASNPFASQQNPMLRCGLVLAASNAAWTGKNISGREDGILTAYEIAQLDLSNTRLVVLSACETALGDINANEGVIGLQRAFKMAGVQQMILSLWKVPDAATKELMTLFYSNWLNGENAGDALRNAQLSMQQKYPPYYWAAFILVE
ncbi:MAG TPA: CHAT domain-containing protein [Chitinophagaceae bacterium]|nr:CHAT domain-containing protein [Chitinophagaceae bacterium]